MLVKRIIVQKLLAFALLLLMVSFCGKSKKNFMFSQTEENLIWQAYSLPAYNIQHSAYSPNRSQREKIKNELTVKQISQQAKLAIENYLFLEQIHRLSLITKRKKNTSAQNNNRKKMYLLLVQKNKQCDKFIENTQATTISNWLYTSCADIKLRLAVYLQNEKLMQESFAARKYYATVLKRNEKFVPALLSNALWLFYAPDIVGGGIDSSLKMLDSAVRYAKHKQTQYLAYLYRSQVHWQMEDKEKWLLDLHSAHKVYPDETFTQEVQKINQEKDLIFFSETP